MQSDRLDKFYAVTAALKGEGAKFVFVTSAAMSGNQKNKVKSHGRKIERNLSAASGESKDDLLKQLTQINR